MTAFDKATGPWSLSEALDFLDNTIIPIRIAAISQSGWPVVASLWYVRDGDVIWCSTQTSSSIARHFGANENCGFEVAADQPPYRGVRGQAHATLHPDRGNEILSLLIDRYFGDRQRKLAKWLLSRTEDEVALRLRLFKCQTWDYTERMRRK